MKKVFLFNRRNYYLLMFILASPILLKGIIIGRLEYYLVMFLVYGLLGMIGETAFSILWKTFYKSRFWTYTEDTIFGSYSSKLNLIPWGIGGFLYLHTINLLFDLFGTGLNSFIRPFSLDYASNHYLFIAILAGLLGYGAIKLYMVFLRKEKFDTVNIKNYLLFISPFILLLTILTIFVNPILVIILIISGFVAFICEYLFGKLVSLLMGKQLWTYNFLSYDNKHITPLSIIPFIMGAFFYLLVNNFFIYFILELLW